MKTEVQVSCSFIIDIIDSQGNKLSSINKTFIENGVKKSLFNKTGILISMNEIITIKEKERKEAIEKARKKIKNDLSKILHDALLNNKKVIQYIAYKNEIKALNNQSKSNEEAEHTIIWTGYTCNDNIKSNNPFEKIRDKVQNKANEYLTPRNPIDINSQIPFEISKPRLPPLPKLVKSQFETKELFNARVQKAMDRRQRQINELQEKYRKDVESRNQTIEKLSFDYDADIENIKNEQKIKKEQLPKKVIEFTQKAFFEIMGEPLLENPVYDAENEIMYVDLKASNADYHKRISLKISMSIAEDFYNNLNNVYPIAIYTIEDNSIILKEIKANYHKTYLATLTDEDFKPETIEVVLEDKKVKFDSEQQKNLKLQNPNLIDTYRVSAIQYGESSESKGLTYNDDITPLVEKLESKPEDSKKWLFIIAVENYDETDPVIFSQNSAELFKETAQKVFGIKERNTYALIDDKATSGAIKDKLQLLLKNVKEGDVIYFYYSGHGVPEQISGESYILPKDKIVDYISKEDEFQLMNIYRRLSDSNASRIFVFIDACFSGKTDNIPLFKGVAPGLMRTKEIKFNESKMVVITAGKNNQFSNSFEEKGHRMFSYYLIQSLATRKDMDIDLLYKDISVKVHDTSFEKGDAYIQEPQIYGNKNLDLFN